jgi:hypothetical protein
MTLISQYTPAVRTYAALGHFHHPDSEQVLACGNLVGAKAPSLGCTGFRSDVERPHFQLNLLHHRSPRTRRMGLNGITFEIRIDDLPLLPTKSLRIPIVLTPSFAGGH